MEAHGVPSQSKEMELQNTVSGVGTRGAQGAPQTCSYIHTMQFIRIILITGSGQKVGGWGWGNYQALSAPSLVKFYLPTPMLKAPAEESTVYTPTEKRMYN